MRKYEGTTRLQGIGIVEGIKAKNLQVGDVLVWNNGGTSLVKEITFSKTGKTLTIVEECKGQDYTRRLGAERIVVVKELNPVEEVKAVEVEEVKEVKEDKAVAFAKGMVKEVNKTVEGLCAEEPAKAVQVVDKLIDKVTETINNIDHEGVRHELRDLENYLKWVYSSLCETVEKQQAPQVKENTTVYRLDLSLGKRMKAVHGLGLKRGDVVTLTFAFGERVTAKVEKVGYMNRQTTNNNMIDRFYIKDVDGNCWDLYKAKTIRVDYRNPRSKKVLTDDLKQFQAHMDWQLSKENVPADPKKLAEVDNYFNEELEEAKRKLAGRKSTLTIKKAVEIVLKGMGYQLGCWDNFLNKLSVRNINSIMSHVGYGDATDIVIRHDLKDYVVSIDFVDNEVDFTSYTKAEYISRYGSEKFED